MASIQVGHVPTMIELEPPYVDPNSVKMQPIEEVETRVLFQFSCNKFVKTIYLTVVFFQNGDTMNKGVSD